MVQALLVALVALFNGIQGPLHWYFFREPVMAGFWVGLIYGKPVEGVILGATINISYLGWISAGGANASDLYWAGLLGTLVGIQTGLSTDAAVAFAVPIGLIGNYAHVAFMTISSIWPARMDKLAEEGDYKTLGRIQLLAGPITVIFIRALPVFLIAYFGSDYIQLMINNIPEWAMAGFSAVGKTLPALGMSMLFKFMYKKNLIVFFILGFIVSAYLGITDLLFFALAGSCLAYLFTIYGSNKVSGEVK